LSKVVEITVDPEGGTSVRTRGFAGPECREASRFVERALGRRKSEAPTAEFHQAQGSGVRLDQSN